MKHEPRRRSVQRGPDLNLRLIIPVIAAIGNHEVFSNRDTTAANVEMIARTGVKLGDSPYYSALHAHARRC